MNPRDRHRLPSWWPLALAAALALAPGCSVEPEPQEDLVPYWTSRGFISYRYVPRNRPAVSAPTAAPAAARDAGLTQQELDRAEERRRQDLLAYRERQRELAEERRRKLQEEEAERVAWWQERQEWHQQERGRQQARREQQSRRLEERTRRGHAEAEHWLRASRPFTSLLGDQR
jgi:hypothetical protein